MKIAAPGIDLIKHFEGLRTKVYPDPATGEKPYTVGYGHTGTDVYPGLSISEAKADEILAQDLKRFEEDVSALLTTPTTQNEFDAMVALAFNIGLANFKESTLLKMHNHGAKINAREQFARWNKAAGKVMNGLTARRAAEAKLYGTA